MAFDAEQRRAALDAFMVREGLNINQWEESSPGMGEGTLRKFMERKTKSMTDQSYERLAAGASQLRNRTVTIAELQGIQISHNGPPSAGGTTAGRTSALEPVKNASDKTVTTLVVWKMALGDSGRQGAFVLSSEVVGRIRCPERVADAKRAFSCKLLDNANGPGYRAGHTIIVDPDVGPVVGDLCVFTDDPTVPGGCDSLAAIFIGFTATHWIVTQNVLPGEQQIARREYPQAWPVVVHYPHGT